MKRNKLVIEKSLIQLATTGAIILSTSICYVFCNSGIVEQGEMNKGLSCTFASKLWEYSIRWKLDILAAPVAFLFHDEKSTIFRAFY